ncbi:FkbM family methyltransferase [Ensifer adhaerens]|uniref:FkbM family methyltransferase n=1 Tax=Ensifer adhaerens TaxID=106592 RepID=UPI003CFD6B0B
MESQPIDQINRDFEILRVLSGESALEMQVREMRSEMAEMRATMEDLKDLARQMISEGWNRQHRGNQTGDKVDQIAKLVGPVGIPLPDGTVLTRSLHGQLYFTDADDTVITPHLLIYRQWEPDLSELFTRLITPEMVFVDVGANIGYFTVLVAAKAGTAARVFAYEPNPRLIPIMKKSIDANWSAAPVTLHEAAASDETGSATLFIPTSKGGNASMAYAKDGAEVIVPMVTLDETLPADLVVDLMKIDIEGFELFALKGANRTIERNPSIKIVLEWSLDQTEAAGVDPKEIANFFTERGFLPFDVTLQDLHCPASAALSWDGILSTRYMNLLLARPA